jgi:hypothetical protein
MKSIIEANCYKKNTLIRLLFAILLLSIVLNGIRSFTPLKTSFYSLWIGVAPHPHPFLETFEKDRYNVSALVFYGRRQYVEILNCYLEQNLIENGGLLREITFILKTNKQEDITYLHELIAQHPGTYFIKKDDNLGWTFHTHYRNLDPDSFYVKIDDDILYIDPNAIKSMLKTKLNNPSAIFISANVINHPAFGPLHLHLMTILNVTNTLSIVPGTGLPVYDWKKSEYANAHHRSFLRHHKEKTLDQYVFPTWDFNALAYNRWSINFILFKGHEVQDVGPGDDEHQISIVIPQKYKKHCLVDGKALVVHFGYIPQRHDGLRDNDFISEYRNLSLKVCNDTLLARRNRGMVSREIHSS